MTTHSTNTPEPLTTPLAARIRLAHAYFQHIADKHSIDVLHIKGYAFSQEIYRKGRYSSDADLLVRPSQVDRFVQILLADGWRIQAHFGDGLSVRARHDPLPRFLGPDRYSSILPRPRSPR